MRAKEVEILKEEVCPDYIHMLVCIPPHMSVAQFMGYLMGKNNLMIFDRYANLKKKYKPRIFWCIGYYADAVGRNKKVMPNTSEAHWKKITPQTRLDGKNTQILGWQE